MMVVVVFLAAYELLFVRSKSQWAREPVRWSGDRACRRDRIMKTASRNDVRNAVL
jgi:hypothetical protein